MPVSIDDVAVTELIQKLLGFLSTRMNEPLSVAAEGIKQQLCQNISSGEDINGNRYDYVSRLTMELPIKRTGQYADTRIRGEVNPSQIAMKATGQSSDEILTQKVSETEYTVGWNSSRSDIIFEGNAKNSGNVSKPKRDPMGLSARNPSDKEFEIVVDEVEKVLERLLSGF